MFLLFFPCTRICKLCPDYEVVMFQPCIGTPLNLGSVSNCYLAIILKPAPPFFPQHLMSALVGLPIMPHPYIPCQSSCLHTRSFYHPGINFICTRIPRPIDSCNRLRYLPYPLSLSTPARIPLFILLCVSSFYHSVGSSAIPQSC